MEISINDALKGKATQIKGKDYLSTAAYIEPFLERMSKFTDNFIVNAIPANQISLTPNGDVNMEDMVFNRMWIQAILPDDNGFYNHDRVMGMVYGLDTRKPIAKLYMGGLNKACCNLCVFDPGFLNIQELEPEHAIDFRPINYLLERVSNVKETLERLSNTEVEYDEKLINENLGRWVRNTMNMQYSSQFGKVKLASSTAIDAFKLLYQDKDSPYYVQPNTNTDMFNIYNAWTQVITDDKRDVITKCEKILLISNILNI